MARASFFLLAFCLFAFSASAAWTQLFGNAARNPDAAVSAPLNLSFQKWLYAAPVMNPVQSTAGEGLYSLSASPCARNKMRTECAGVEHSRSCPVGRDAYGLVAAGDRIYSLTYNRYNDEASLDEFTLDSVAAVAQYPFFYDSFVSGDTPAHLASDGGRVYAFVSTPTGRSTIYAFNTATKSFDWRYMTNGRVFSPPVVAGNQLVFAVGDNLYSFDKDSGAQQWSASLGFTPSQLLASGGAVYAGGYKGYGERIASFHLNNGTLRWGPIYDKGTFMAEHAGILYIVQGGFGNDFRPRALNADTGQQVWQNSGVKCARFVAYLDGPNEVVALCFQNDYNDNTFSIKKFSPANGNLLSSSAVLSGYASAEGIAVVGDSLLVSTSASTYLLGGLPAPLRSITVSPNLANLLTNGQQQFSAVCTNACNANITCPTLSWSTTIGSVTQAGLLSAGSAPGNGVVTGTAESVSGSSSVYVFEPPACTRDSPPCTPLFVCGEITQPGYYALMKNVSQWVYPCFDVKADDVLLDCTGHNISFAVSGIQAHGRRGLTVRNCVLAPMYPNYLSRGIDFSGTSSSSLYDNTFLLRPNTTGVMLNNSHNNTVLGNSFSGGQVGSGGVYDSGNVFSRNVFSDTLFGISILFGFGEEVADNSFIRNKWGFSMVPRTGIVYPGDRVYSNSFTQNECGIAYYYQEVDVENASFSGNDVDACLIQGGDLALLNPSSQAPLKLYIRTGCPYNPGVSRIHVDWWAYLNFTNAATGLPVSGSAFIYDKTGAFVASADVGEDGLAYSRLREKSLRYEYCTQGSFERNMTPHRFVFAKGNRAEEFYATIDHTGWYSFAFGNGTPVGQPTPPPEATPTPPPANATPIPPPAPPAGPPPEDPLADLWGGLWPPSGPALPPPYGTPTPAPSSSPAAPTPPSEPAPEFGEEGWEIEYPSPSPEPLEQIGGWQNLPLAGGVSEEDRARLVRRLRDLGEDPADEEAVLREYERLKKERKEAEAKNIFAKFAQMVSASASSVSQRYAWLAFAVVVIVVAVVLYYSSTLKKPKPSSEAVGKQAVSGSVFEALKRLRERQ